MKKQDFIGEKTYQKLWSTGTEPARLYGLAKVQKNDLCPVLSIPGSPCHKLNKYLTPLFERVPGANIETSSLEARKNWKYWTWGKRTKQIHWCNKFVYKCISFWGLWNSFAIFLFKWQRSWHRTFQLQNLTETGSHQCSFQK